MKKKEVKDLLKDPKFTYAALIFEDGDGDGEDGDEEDGGEEKKYTQSEVNAMISERLKRERAKSKAHEDEAAKLARMSESETSSDQYWAAELITSVGSISEGFISSEPVMDLPADGALSLLACFSPLSEEEKAALKKEAKETFKKPEPKAGGAGTMTRADILKISDRAERQKQIKAHPELFR